VELLVSELYARCAAAPTPSLIADMDVSCSVPRYEPVTPKPFIPKERTPLAPKNCSIASHEPSDGWWCPMLTPCTSGDVPVLALPSVSTNGAAAWPAAGAAHASSSSAAKAKRARTCRRVGPRARQVAGLTTRSRAWRRCTLRARRTRVHARAGTRQHAPAAPSGAHPRRGAASARAAQLPRRSGPSPRRCWPRCSAAPPWRARSRRARTAPHQRSGLCVPSRLRARAGAGSAARIMRSVRACARLVAQQRPRRVRQICAPARPVAGCAARRGRTARACRCAGGAARCPAPPALGGRGAAAAPHLAGCTIAGRRGAARTEAPRPLAAGAAPRRARARARAAAFVRS
jgi:hypothetical protein